MAAKAYDDVHTTKGTVCYWPVATPSGRVPQEVATSGTIPHGSLRAKLVFPDIVRRVHGDFQGSDRTVVGESLDSYTGPETDRVCRCILHLANGDVSKVGHFVEAAIADYRDVIHWAEYDRDDHWLRDFTRPFQ